MLVAVSLSAGCRPGPAPPLTVVISGDTAGWIVPCGCTSNQSGGLPRRATYLAQVRQQAAVVALDVGGAPHGRSPYDLAKLEAILEGERAMEVAAHNIGASEAALGAEQLEQLVDADRVPWLSANVRRGDGQRFAPAARIVARGGRRLAIVGVLSPRYARPGLRVDPPSEAIRAALANLSGGYDAAVVLAYLPEGELRELAAGLPEVDVVCGGPTGQPIRPERFGPTLLVSATNKGKFVARLDWPQSASWTGEVVELDDRFPDDREQVANLQQFRQGLSQRDFSPRQTGFLPNLAANLPADYRVAGSQQCAPCHGEDQRLWEKSRHAHAWQSLAQGNSQVDPECQRCHSTCYGLPGGFESIKASRQRTGVGCESCHGPSAGHVADPRVRTPHFGQAMEQCLGCHDEENSPKFNAGEYWAKIRHGSASSDPEPAAPKERP